MLRKLILIAVLAGVSSIWTAYAQQPVRIVRGQVLDAQTGESLPSANIRIEGTYRGTITNAEGVFEIAIQEVPADLVFRYIGYETQRRTITDRSVEQIEIRMQQTTYQMPELVVTDENPAIGIMRCVIDRKQERRALLSSYASEAYTRFTVSNDTSIVAIIETLSEVFWDKEQGMRELIKSRRQTLNLGTELTLDMPAVLLMANLYDDNIPLLDHNFAGVTHPDALDIYRFSLQGTRLMDDRLVYDISVAPKSRLSTAFSGEISVLADECALLEVALEPGEAFLFPPPITGIDITLHQQYDSFDGSPWLPIDFRSDFELGISFGPLLSFPTFKARQLSRITNYEIEATLPDSLYAEEKRLGIDQESIAADTLLDRAGIAVPLDEPERVAYAGIDSTLTLEKAFAPSGFLTHFGPGMSENGAGEGTGFLAKISQPIPGVRPRLRFNRAEGFSPGLAVEVELGRLDIESHGRWSHGRWSRKLGQPWTYGVRGSVGLGPEKRKTLGVSYFNGIESRFGGETGYELIISPATIYSLFGSGDYSDHLRNRRISAFGRYRKERFSIGLSASREMPAPVEAITAYDLFAKPGAPRPNPPVSDRRLHSVALTGSYSFFGMADSTMIVPRFLIRSATLGVEYGKLEGMKNAYVRLNGNISWSFDTFFSRRPFPNTLTIRLKGGTRLGDLPIHRFGTISGSIGSMRAFGTLHTQIGRPYEGDRYVGFFWEHNFRTIPFELLGLHGLARRGYGVIVGGGHARTYVSPSPLVERPDLHLSPDGMHHEITVSLNGVLGIFRVSFARRLDRPGHSIGIGLGASFL